MRLQFGRIGLPREDLQGGAVDARITGRDEAVAGCEGQRRTLPIGDDATGAFDDRRQCKVVEHIKRDIDANIDTPRGVDWEPRTSVNICTPKYTPKKYNKQK